VITPTDLRSPLGEVEDSLFPGESSADIDTRLDAYLTEAYGLLAAYDDSVQRDVAARAWAMHRAFKAAHTIILSQPASATAEEGGSRTYTAEQLRQLLLRGAGFLTEYGQVLAALAAGEEPTTEQSPSRPVANTFVW
jgi:hypothetical protein